MSDAPDNDVVQMVRPDTGAREMELADPSNPDVALPVAMYQAEKMTRSGIRSAEAAILYRFQPTMAQRGKLMLGEDLYLLMLLPNGRAPLPIELQVGPGSFQLEPPKGASSLLGLDGTPIAQRSVLWTPDQERGG